MAKLSDKQAKVFQFIKSSIDQNGYSPTVGEIANGIGITRSVAHGHLERLKDKGLVDWVPSQSRTLRINKKVNV